MSEKSNEILYNGKSKTIFKGDDEGSYVIRYKDTATAFNGERKEELAGKGRLNAAISHLLYKYLMQNGVETHLIEVKDEVTAVVKKADIIMVEVIVRNFAAGGFSKKYGIEEGSALKNTVVEFCVKSDTLGDPAINESQITALGLATKEELSCMTELALKVNDLLISLFDKASIRLIDFKLEFGRCGGKIILCDEISPDSCRLWDSATNKKLDKDRFRRDMGDVIESYQEVFDRIKQTFV